MTRSHMGQLSIILLSIINNSSPKIVVKFVVTLDLLYKLTGQLLQLMPSQWRLLKNFLKYIFHLEFES